LTRPFSLPLNRGTGIDRAETDGAEDESTGDGRGVGGAGAGDEGLAFQFERAAVEPLLKGDLDAEALAGADEPAVLDGAEAAKDEAAVAERAEEFASGLDHRLDHHHAGENGEAGEVIAEVLLRGGDLLEGDDAGARLARLAVPLDDSVNQIEVHGATIPKRRGAGQRGGALGVSRRVVKRLGCP